MVIFVFDIIARLDKYKSYVTTLESKIIKLDKDIIAKNKKIYISTMLYNAEQDTNMDLDGVDANLKVNFLWSPVETVEVVAKEENVTMEGIVDYSPLVTDYYFRANEDLSSRYFNLIYKLTKVRSNLQNKATKTPRK